MRFWSFLFPLSSSHMNLTSLVFPLPVSPMMTTGMPERNRRWMANIFMTLSYVSSYVGSGSGYLLWLSSGTYDTGESK